MNNYLMNITKQKKEPRKKRNLGYHQWSPDLGTPYVLSTGTEPSNILLLKVQMLNNIRISFNIKLSHSCFVIYLFL